MANSEKKNYVLENDQPVVALDCTSAFKNLSKNEKYYAHFLSRASWNGGLITLVQTSHESPLIFIFLHKLFSSVPLPELNAKALKAGLTENEYRVNTFFIQLPE